MATNPFAGAGLSQFGQELSKSDSDGGIGKLLLAYGLQASGIGDSLNKILQPSGVELSNAKLQMVKPPSNLGMAAPTNQTFSVNSELVEHQDGLDYINEGK